MKLTLKRYSYLLTFQFCFLIADLLFNSFGQFLLAKHFEAAVVLFVLQDVLIIGEYILFAYTLRSTCVYEVGASHIILQKCKLFLFITILYFLLSAAQHFYITYNTLNYNTKSNASMSLTLTIIFFFQRIMSIGYYYSCKRTALIMADPRFESSNIDWIARHLGEM